MGLAKILECVPNFSEGRDEEVIRAIADSIRAVAGVSLLHIDSNADANRTVMTFAGAPGPVVDAALAAIRTAAQRIDMSQQQGEHPRIGATDVCPLVPLSGMTMDEASDCARQLAARVGEMGVPVYLYEHSAMQAHRRTLPQIRKGQYEGFAEKMAQPGWEPDFGPAKWNPRTGVTVIGARKILVAFNISLETTEVSAARFIASRLRSSGWWEGEEGSRTHRPGLLSEVRAIGWYMKGFGNAQVSMNLTDFSVTGPLAAWKTVQRLAAEAGTGIAGSEVIGLIPESCLMEAGAYFYLTRGEPVPADRLLQVRAGVQQLGLERIRPFVPSEKILGYALSRNQLFLHG